MNKQMDLLQPTQAAEPAVAAMDAISLWQPYASLIACKAKRFETRHWRAPEKFIGQRIAIHAAARKPTRAEVDELLDEVGQAFGFSHWHERIPYGAVVCTARLVGAFQVRRCGVVTVELSDGRTILDDGFGDYSPGRWCWELADVETFAPIAAKGAQGWWRWAGAA